MLDTKLMSIVSKYDTKIIGGTIVKAGNIIGYLKAGNVAEAKSILAKNTTVILLKVIINFGGMPSVVSEYGLQTVGTLPSEGLSVFSHYSFTKSGGMLVKPIYPAKIPIPIYSTPGGGYTKVGEILFSDYMFDKNRFFTTSILTLDKGILWGEVTNADRSVKGWVRLDKAQLKPTWSDFVKDVTNVVIQQPLQAVRDTVETIQENAGTIKTLLGLGVIALVISIFKN